MGTSHITKAEVPRRLPSGRNPCKPKFAGSGMGFSLSFQESDARNPRRLQAHTRGCDQLHTELYCRILKYFNCVYLIYMVVSAWRF